jgi:uroporphyrinogen decarboxylase
MEKQMSLDQFWKENDEAQKENCFNPEATQIAMGILMSDECVYSELNEKGDPWGEIDIPRQFELNKRYNDKAEKIVGKRLLKEIAPKDHIAFPYIKRVGEVFGGQYLIGVNTGEWLESPIKTPDALEKQLEKIDHLDFESFILPENWEKESRKIYEETGKRIKLRRHVRGPVTLGTSIFGVENLIFLAYDSPELFKRFSRTILRVVLEINRVIDREAGYTSETAPSGFSFADDDCNLMTPEMYKDFGYPVLKGCFEHYSPNPGDKRYQHSDSSMAHLLPILGTLDMNGCNFGPTVMVDEIRKYLPNARIDGCLAPFTFMNNNAEEIRKEVKRDCLMIKETGTRGLNIYTAGSINNGSSLESLKVVMETVQEFGQY